MTSGKKHLLSAAVQVGRSQLQVLSCISWLESQALVFNLSFRGLRRLKGLISCFYLYFKMMKINVLLIYLHAQPKDESVFQATAKNNKIRGDQLILPNDRFISISFQKIFSFSGSFVEQNSLCMEKSFKMDLRICKLSDGIKGAAFSALVQGLLMPVKVFLWNSLHFGLVHRTPFI